MKYQFECIVADEKKGEWQKVTLGLHGNSTLNAKFASTLLRNFATAILKFNLQKKLHLTTLDSILKCTAINVKFFRHYFTILLVFNLTWSFIALLSPLINQNTM